jgi:hypothetical protein
MDAGKAASEKKYVRPRLLNLQFNEKQNFCKIINGSIRQPFPMGDREWEREGERKSGLSYKRGGCGGAACLYHVAGKAFTLYYIGEVDRQAVSGVDGDKRGRCRNRCVKRPRGAAVYIIGQTDMVYGKMWAEQRR